MHTIVVPLSVGKGQHGPMITEDHSEAGSYWGMQVACPVIMAGKSLFPDADANPRTMYREIHVCRRHTLGSSYVQDGVLQLSKYLLNVCLYQTLCYSVRGTQMSQPVSLKGQAL